MANVDHGGHNQNTIGPKPRLESIWKTSMSPSLDAVFHRPGYSDALPTSVPVLIVGGGPTGLLQALLLSRLGGTVLKINLR